MKIVFVSNYFNHHQKFFSDGLAKLSESFYFISTWKMSAERRHLGYGNWIEPGYVIDAFDNGEGYDRASVAVAEADVVIVGSVHGDLLMKMRGDALLFKYSERLFKSVGDKLKYPFRLVKLRNDYLSHQNTYLLCAGAKVDSDYRKLGLYKNRSFRWGYFPEFIEYFDIDRLIDKKEKASILWCGRFLNWKHPDDAVRAAKRLKKLG